MLGLGMASAHAPTMLQKAQYCREPASPAIIEGYVQRIEAAYARTPTGCGFAYWPAVP